MKKWLTFVICVSALFTSQAFAKSEYFKGFDWQVGMEMPLQIAARGQVYLPNNFFATAGVGMSPQFLQSMSSSFTDTFGVTYEEDSTVFEQALSGSWVVELRGGWSAGDGKGLYFDVGYMLMTGGGSDTSREDLGAMLDIPFGYGNSWADTSPEVATQIHALTAHVGHKWRMWDPIIIAAEAGIMKPISSTTTVNWSSNHFGYDNDENEIADYMDGELAGSYVLPTISLWMTYKF